MQRFDVTLVGDTALDLMLYGLPTELPVERELLVSRMEFALGGSAAITAHNLSALGARVGLVTSVSEDPFARLCLDQLREAGVDLSRCVPSQEHGGATVMLQHHDCRRALTFPGSATGLRFQDLDLGYLTSARHFHASSIFLQRALRDDLELLFTLLKKTGMTISMDTNDDPWNEWPDIALKLLPLVDIFLPNESEVCRLIGLEDAARATEVLRRQVKTLVVKRGSRGASVFQGQIEATLPPVPVEVLDAVGAGDSFNAGFISAFLEGHPPEECLHRGNVVAGLSTSRPGGTSAFRDRLALTDFLQRHPYVQSTWSTAERFLS